MGSSPHSPLLDGRFTHACELLTVAAKKTSLQTPDATRGPAAREVFQAPESQA